MVKTYGCNLACETDEIHVRQHNERTCIPTASLDDLRPSRCQNDLESLAVVIAICAMDPLTSMPSMWLSPDLLALASKADL